MSTKITYEELEERFTVRTLQGFGEVIIIPGDEFDPDWEAQLGEEYECLEHTYYRKPVMLVRKAVKENADANANTNVSTNADADKKTPEEELKAATRGDLLELRARLDGRIDVLGEMQAAMKKDFAALQKKFDETMKWLEDERGKDEKFFVEVNNRLDALEEHEHSSTGKIMVPYKKTPK